MTTTITPVDHAPPIVPPWLGDPVLPLPDPISDTPTTMPVDDEYVAFRCDEAYVGQRGQTLAEYVVVFAIVAAAVLLALKVLSS